MTIVYSRLTTPRGQPIQQHPVIARLMGPDKWTSDGEGRIVTDVETRTDDDGYWELDLVPCGRLEWCEHAYYQIVEGPLGVHYAYVPESPTPVLLRRILIDEPPPIDRQPVISTLGSLHNVSSHVDNPQAGQALVSTPDREWTTKPYQLVALGDIDARSVGAARIGDKLEYLGPDRGWGIYRPPPPVNAVVDRHPDDTTGYRALFLLTDFDPSMPIEYRWGDESTPDTWTPWPDGTDRTDHVYAAGDYTAKARYQGDTTEWTQPVHIPFS